MRPEILLNGGGGGLIWGLLVLVVAILAVVFGVISIFGVGYFGYWFAKRRNSDKPALSGIAAAILPIGFYGVLYLLTDVLLVIQYAIAVGVVVLLLLSLAGIVRLSRAVYRELASG